jgi:ABC-type nickel/cobalt efflux system permease component RcnA
MYTEADFIGSKTALSRFMALYSAIAVLLVTVFVYSILGRVEWLAYASAIVLGVVSLFLWGNFGGRLLCWRRFLTDMQQGLEKEAAGYILSIDDGETTKEGLEFRALHIMTGDETDKAGGRLLYVETSRFPLNVTLGQKVRCRLFGNYVKDIEPLEEQ